MKLLSVIETLSRGGAERILVNTLPELKKLGIDCEVAIIFDRDDLATELEEKGIKVHKLHLSYKWNIFEGVFKLNKLIKNNNYNIVHAHLFFAYFYTGLVKIFRPKIKTITTFHNMGFDEYPANTWIKKVRKKLDRFVAVKLTNNRTAVSNAVKFHYKKNFQTDNIDVIFNSFPIADFTKYHNNESNQIIDKIIHNSSNKFVVLTPGRYVEKKGHKYLIEAITILNKKYTNFIFIFVGKGPLEKSLKNMASVNIKFISEMPHEELMKLYREVDLIVIPSVYEAFGLVIGEAMIMEKGLVSTQVNGILELVTHQKEGLLALPRDSNSLAQNIEKLYLDKDLRNTLSSNAKKKIQQFDTKLIAIQWEAYYKEMLNG
ncbi:MAG: glycosyltransferase family 4 protein [Alcanivoracaceae bacterium]|nr:glycosyltransferase family 4 protein [Alcanivoracaceae bacterium]